MTTVLRAHGLVPVPDGGLAPLDLAVEAGTVICLVGRDARQRSAYARSLAGAQYPQAGEVELLGQRLSELDDRRWLALRREVGLVTREAPLVSSHDALRNVMLPALYHGIGTRQESERKARACLERLQFCGEMQRLPAFLRELDRKILALARALMLEPKLLFLDDPLKGLHGDAVHQVSQAIGEWCRQTKAALVYATDDASFMRAFADRIVFIAPPMPQVFDSWTEFHDARDREVQRYFSEFRSEARAFD